MELGREEQLLPSMAKPQTLSVSIILVAFASGCGGGSGGNSPPPAPPPQPTSDYSDVSATNLPVASLGGMCMDADQGDVDGDGDVDLVLAQEFSVNLVLLNDGSGVFSRAAGAVGGGLGDNEDVRLADFDGDGDPDMLTVHEDDAVHTLFSNDGEGVFTPVPGAIPVNSIANAAEVIDLNSDTRPDILLGNQGPNLVLLQLANGTFVDDTANRPIGVETTQDLLLVDIDGDGDQDLLAANEAGNQLFVNDGNGIFSDETATRLPGNDGETREADAADVDGDGDLDIVLGNVNFTFGRPIQNQLLLNDGTGVYTDATSASLAAVANQFSSFTIKFVDIDADGDPDVLSARNDLGQGGGVVVWVNDGSGTFASVTQTPFSTAPRGSTFDIEVVDVNADGRQDLYFCNRTGTDQLYIRN